MKRCPICQGSRTIRLPVRHEPSLLASSYDSALATEAVETCRTYPCPECSQKADPDRLDIMTSGIEFRIEPRMLDAPGYMDAVRQDAAYGLVGFVLRSGAIAFHVGAGDDDWHRRITAKLGVVSPAQVATFERRVAEHQEVVAREVVAEASAMIDSWGRYYGRETISKSEAHRFIGEALNKVLGARRATR